MSTTDISKVNEKNSFMGHFFRTNIAWIATAFVFVFLTVELLVVSKSNTETASFILMHSDKIQLILILILPLLSQTIAFFGLFFIWTGFVFNQEKLETQYPWTLILSLVGVVLVIMAFFSGTFLAILVGCIYTYILSDFKLKFELKTFNIKKWRIKRKIPESGIYQLFNRDDPSMIISYPLMFIAYFFITSGSTIHIPLECDYLSTGKTIQTQVLSTDSRYAYALNNIGFKPQIITLNTLNERNPLHGSSCPAPSKANTSKTRSNTSVVSPKPTTSVPAIPQK